MPLDWQTVVVTLVALAAAAWLARGARRLVRRRFAPSQTRVRLTIDQSTRDDAGDGTSRPAQR